jgi:hypothetical protein
MELGDNGFKRMFPLLHENLRVGYIHRIYMTRQDKTIATRSQGNKTRQGKRQEKRPSIALTKSPKTPNSRPQKKRQNDHDNIARQKTNTTKRHITAVAARACDSFARMARNVVVSEDVADAARNRLITDTKSETKS